MLALLLLTMSLTGCIGDPPGDDEVLKEQTAAVSAATGGLEGVVTDTAIQPVAGANVTLEELGETVRTASDGSYAFSQVAPGTYTVTIQAQGFISTQSTLTLTAGEVTIHDVLLEHLFTEEAYTQAFEITGFFECGMGWKLLPGAPFGESSLATCAIVNLFVADNTTNDRFLHTIEMEAPLENIVYEMDWDPQGNSLGEQMWTTMDVQGFINTNGTRLVQLRDAPPLYTLVDRSELDSLEANFTQRCEAGEEDWCAMNFRDQGWPFILRVFANSDCLGTPVSTCVILQQSFTHYVTGFYNAPAPAGYRVTQAS